MAAPTPAGRFLESVYTAVYNEYDDPATVAAALAALPPLAHYLHTPGLDVPRNVRGSYLSATKWDGASLGERAASLVKVGTPRGA